MKRLMDVIIASSVLIIFSPVILLIVLLIRFKMGSPVLFKQNRPGLHGAPFMIYKLRTMTNERDESGELLSDELRLTSFGNCLRKLSLDEFPQLINVVKGELSLVGPRPLLSKYLDLYTDDQTRRHEVKPGITGWAQVNGRNAITWEKRFELDVWYVENRSILLDLKILFITLKQVMSRVGVNQPGHVTMPDFTGGKKDHHNLP